MLFAKPQPYRTPSGPVARTPRNLEIAIALQAQAIVVAQRHLDMLESQKRYLELELSELKVRQVAPRPMAVIRPTRPAPAIRQPKPTAPKQTVRADDPDLLAAIERAIKEAQP